MLIAFEILHIHPYIALGRLQPCYASLFVDSKTLACFQSRNDLFSLSRRLAALDRPRLLAGTRATPSMYGGTAFPLLGILNGVRAQESVKRLHGVFNVGRFIVAVGPGRRNDRLAENHLICPGFIRNRKYRQDRSAQAKRQPRGPRLYRDRKTQKIDCYSRRFAPDSVPPPVPVREHKDNLILLKHLN